MKENNFFYKWRMHKVPKTYAESLRGLIYRVNILLQIVIKNIKTKFLKRKK